MEKDKKVILEKILETIQRNIDNLEKAYESARQRSIESEGRMQSRYDTHKEETANEANAIGEKILELSKQFAALQSLKPPSSNESIGIGHIVNITEIMEDGNSTQESKVSYFIVSIGGGVDLADFGLTAISAPTPIAQALMGHAIGDTVILNLPRLKKKLRIDNII